MFGLALLLAGWGTYVYRIATPGMYDREGVFKGADYRAFYVLGLVALERRPDWLYDELAHVRLSREHFEPNRTDSLGNPSHGPQVALFFAPFALLPYTGSRLTFAFLSALLYLGCAAWIARHTRHVRREPALLVLLLLASPSFVTLITFGQAAALGLLALTIAFEGWRRGNWWLTGIGAGLLAYKPTLALLPFLLLLMTRQWRALAVAVTIGAGQLLAGAMYFGPGVIADYVASLTRTARNPAFNQPHPELLHSFKGALTLIVGYRPIGTVLYLLLSALAVFMLYRVWRCVGSWPMRAGAIGLCLVLISPHLTVYDLVLLTPGLLLLLDWAIEEGRTRIQWLITGIYLAPLLGPVLAASTRIQVSVLLMAALLVDLARTRPRVRVDTVEAI